MDFKTWIISTTIGLILVVLFVHFAYGEKPQEFEDKNGQDYLIYKNQICHIDVTGANGHYLKCYRFKDQDNDSHKKAS